MGRGSNYSALQSIASSLESSSSSSSSSSSCGSHWCNHCSGTSFLGARHAPEIGEQVSLDVMPAMCGATAKLRNRQFTSFLFGFIPTTECGDYHGLVMNCHECDTKQWRDHKGHHHDRGCSSSECYRYKGECTERKVAGKFWAGSWYWYQGAGRPWLNGDKIEWAQMVQVMGPGKPPKEGASANEKDRAPPKDDRHGQDRDLAWIEVWAPGNQKLITVKTLDDFNPRNHKWIWWEPREPYHVDDPPEPYSKEAQIAKMLYMKAQMEGKIPPDFPIPRPCDRQGHIKDGTSDGTFCHEDQVCVTAVPVDLDTVKGYKLSKRSRDIAGQPWCVPDWMVSHYEGPIEINCPATGSYVKHPGAGNGCYSHEKYSREDTVRLPGKIIRRYGISDWPRGWFSSTGSHFTEKQAEKWIQTGELDLRKPDLQNNEFLAKGNGPARAPKPAPATAPAPSSQAHEF